MNYLIVAVLALILLWVNIWPSTAIHQQAQQQLNRDSGQSFLRQALLGLTPARLHRRSSRPDVQLSHHLWQCLTDRPIPANTKDPP